MQRFEKGTPKIDIGVLAMSAELRALERQAAEELAQWKVVIEARKVVDATPAAVMLGMLMSKELLDLKRRALELQQSQVVQVEQAPRRVCHQAGRPALILSHPGFCPQPDNIDILSGSKAACSQ
jgi:hypothetical protein